MIQESAKVVQVEGDFVTVEAAIKSTCSSCQAQSECGTGAISRAMAPKSQQLTLHTPVPVKVGQTVTIGIPEIGVLSASAWLYVVPLVLFIIGVVGFHSVFSSWGLEHELLSLPPSMILGFFTYKKVSVVLAKQDSSRFQPVLLSTQTASKASASS